MSAEWGWLAQARIYDLAQPLQATTLTSPNHPPFRMALIRRYGDSMRADGSSGANELPTMGGHTGTHLDALCHGSQAMRLYGGIDAAEASLGGWFQQLGVQTISPILWRGILLDVPCALGMEELGAVNREEQRAANSHSARTRFQKAVQRSAVHQSVHGRSSRGGGYHGRCGRRAARGGRGK